MSALGTFFGWRGAHWSKRTARNTADLSRQARKTTRNTAATNQLLEQNNAVQAWQVQQTEMHRQMGLRYRYDTDPAFRVWWHQQQAVQATAQQQQLAVAEARRQRSRQARVQLLTVPMTLVAIVVVAVLVWGPQLAISRVRQRPVALWRRVDLTQMWSRVTTVTAAVPPQTGYSGGWPQA